MTPAQKKLILLLLLTLAIPFMVSCANQTEASDSEMAAVMLCGDCGEIKGGDDCCADAPACPGCSLHMGSPGCCKMEKGTDAKMCACGAPAGSDACEENCSK